MKTVSARCVCSILWLGEQSYDKTLVVGYITPIYLAKFVSVNVNLKITLHSFIETTEPQLYCLIGAKPR